MSEGIEKVAPPPSISGKAMMPISRPRAETKRSQVRASDDSAFSFSELIEKR
jgi:hypothetical protein